ncbi:unnamed protein product [Fusarium graminearum]|uniref:Uncharacterized protein n=1 Tax=Gibberella zeae TaxID=5518 RepID=A0A4E9EDE8_GIBZA|nr:unnamed protein product [Fusarium graminearum]CAG1966422.1 unnamed protein product [Fusarium graminearum]
MASAHEEVRAEPQAQGQSRIGPSERGTEKKKKSSSNVVMRAIGRSGHPNPPIPVEMKLGILGQRTP